jgi:Flp pilus assembly protein TadB
MVRTWHIEAAVMAAVLLGTVLVAGGGWVEWVGAAAVWLSSRHMSVADRLREREERRPTSDVECYRWLDRYWLSKEALWLVYFVALGAWSALAGVVLFLVYPYWRRGYLRFRPLSR